MSFEDAATEAPGDVFTPFMIVDSSAAPMATLNPEEYRRAMELLADLINTLKRHDERVAAAATERERARAKMIVVDAITDAEQGYRLHSPMEALRKIAEAIAAGKGET